jgi:hypothetical protein
MNELITYQRNLFAFYEEFFRRATGKSAKDFAPLEKFSETVPTLRSRLTAVQSAFEWAEPELNKIYKHETIKAFGAAADLGGIKVVQGGGAHFRASQLNAAKRMILYTDTVLIPDPVFALVEAKRPEERFHSIRILEEIFFLLRLKPLVDADLGVPPVVFFPSFDRLLSAHEPITKEKLTVFLGGTLGNLLGFPLTSAEDAAAFATDNPERFLQAVEAKQLLVAPGGPLREPLDEALKRYIREIGAWRSREHMALIEGLSKSQQVCNALLERLEPQFHLIDNSLAMRAQPLLSVDQQAYYFKLSADASGDLLERESKISPATRSSVDALSTRQFEWLSNASIDALVEMRLNNENELFRKRLAESTSILRDAELQDLDRVAAEVARGVGGLLNDYSQAARKLEEKYRRKYKSLAGVGWLSVGAFLIPHLAPLIASAPGLTLAGKYLYEKMGEKTEKRELAGSLIGILANARDEPAQEG